MKTLITTLMLIASISSWAHRSGEDMDIPIGYIVKHLDDRDVFSFEWSVRSSIKYPTWVDVFVRYDTPATDSAFDRKEYIARFRIDEDDFSRDPRTRHFKALFSVDVEASELKRALREIMRRKEKEVAVRYYLDFRFRNAWAKDNQPFQNYSMNFLIALLDLRQLNGNPTFDHYRVKNGPNEIERYQSKMTGAFYPFDESYVDNGVPY